MGSINEELYFLILRYLEEGPCHEAVKALKEEVKKYSLLPKRIDWEGKCYPRGYDQLVSSHPHVAADHLERICWRLPGLLDEKFPPNVARVKTLLGAGSQSLLRSQKTAGVTLRPSGYLHCRQNALISLPNQLINKPQLLRSVVGKEYTGLQRPTEKQPSVLYSKYQLWRRFLGHLSAVYCVLYDRTGNYIFTGADDKLIKIWSAMSGRLLATLRGHDGEIVDIAVSYENTLLASASCDKSVRIWCLQTTACLYVLHAHSATVTSLQFCPMIRADTRFLVSTGEDATVCFWKYKTEDNKFQERPTKYIERSRTGAKMLCSSFSPGGLFLATGNSDSVIRIYCMMGGEPRKIGELEAHTDMVDSIQYCHHGNRFISGSKDGTARIWRCMRAEWLNLIISMSADSSQRQAGEAEHLKVNMVAWTCDDDKVLTAVSDFTVRVWCSTTGQPLISLKGHEEDVFVMECAPFNNNLVVTAGHDGRIKLWDMRNGHLLLDYYNMIEGQGFGAAYDCKWSPLHHSFSATDSHGHLMRFGLGTNNALTEDKIPTELYFHTDYRALIRDGNGYVIDEFSQRPVHLLPPPFLVDVNAVPYPPKYQRLVPGRQHLPHSYLIPSFQHLPNGEREVLDQELPATPAPTAGDGTAPPSDENTPTNQSPSTSSGLVQPAPQADHPLVNWRKVIGQLSDEKFRAMTQVMMEATEREITVDYAELRKKPHHDGEHTSSSGTSHRPTRTRLTARSSKTAGQGRPAGEQAVRNRLTARALYDTDVESEEDDDQPQTASPSEDSYSSESQPSRRGRVDDGMQSDGGSYGMTTSCSDSANSSLDYSDWEVDNKANLQPPARKSNRKQMSFKSETNSPQNSPSVLSRNGVRSTRLRSTRASRARRKAKKLTEQFNQSMADVDAAEGDVQHNLAPEWLTSDKPQRTPYFPQMGDEVIYFFQGHKMYIDEVVKHKLYEPKNFPWEKIPQLKEQELTRVTGIKFEVRQSTKLRHPRWTRLCSVKLDVIFPHTGRSTGTSFTVKYHDMDGVIDFVVLRQFYDISQQRNWQVGDKFRSIIDNKWYSGTVTALIPHDMNYPDCQFLCLQVTWDDGTCDKMSPWDLEPLPDDDEEILQGTEVMEEDEASLKYNPTSQEWPECGQQQECTRISSLLEQLMGYSICEQFNAPVDLNLFPNYSLEISYPMDLSTVRSRLDNGFYRRVSSIYYDIRCIERNAEQFNMEGSKIARDARIVADICSAAIRDTKCVDIQAIYNRWNLKDRKHQSAEASSTKGKGRARKRSFDWKAAASRLLEEAIDKPDAEPFREPVDLSSYPDYTDKVNLPMDFGTIISNLEADEYTNLNEVFKDVRLVFSNSKKYNTQPRSQIYSMTMRLKSFMEEKMNQLSSEASHYTNGNASSSHVADDPLITLPFRRCTRATRVRELSPANTSTARATSSHYSTRSATGTRKPKRFADDMLVEDYAGSAYRSQTGSQVHVTRKTRRIVESSDEELASTSRGKRVGRLRASTVSDYEKDTDEGETGEKMADESFDSSETSSDSEDGDGSDVNITEECNKKLSRPVRSTKRTRQPPFNERRKVTNGYARSTRLRKSTLPTFYNEDSDNDDSASDDSYHYTGTKSRSSKGKSLKRRRLNN